MKIERIYIPSRTVDRTDPEQRKNRHDLSEDKDRRQWKEETHREEEQVEVIDTSVAPLVMGKKKLDLIV
jgi:hypothetical protein